MTNAFDQWGSWFHAAGPIAAVLAILALAGILVAFRQLMEIHYRCHLPQYLKQHVEVLLRALRTKDQTLSIDPSLHFLARNLKIDLYAAKYGSPGDFFEIGMAKFLQDVLRRHREDPPERRLFTLDEIDRILSELDEMVLRPGAVICFECGEKILPDQDRCPACGWDWKSPFQCPECEAEILPGQDRCPVCGWVWK